MANGTQSKHLFTVIPHDLGLMPRLEIGEARVVFGLSASGDGILSDGGNVLLAVYDLDQYIQHQLDVGNGDFDIGTFTGAKSTFPGPLRDHEVKAGTGVLLLAQLSISKHPNPNNSTENWVVSQVVSKEETQTPAFQLNVQMLARIDATGNNDPLSPIEYQTVGIAGPATPDFSTFVHTKGGHRKIAFRFLSSDSTTVLLSQLNVVHCAAASPLLIRYADNGRRPQVGGAPPGIQSALPKPSRVPPFDPTGLYVERLPPFDTPADPDDITAPGTLWIHQVGHTVVGWYNPLPSLVLAGQNPSTGLPFFSSSQQTQALSGNRLCFLATPNLHSWGLQFLRSKPKQNATHFVALTSFGPGDDPDLLNQVDAATQFAGRLQAGWMQLHNTGNDALAPSVTLSLSDTATPSVFVRASSHPKLSFELERLLNSTLPTNVTSIDVKTLTAISSALRSQFVEPLPPKILSELMRGIIGPAMISAVVHWRAATDALNVSEQRVAEIELDNALNAIAVGLAAASPGGVIPDELVAQVRGTARTSTVLSSNIDGAKNVSILDTLESAMGEIVNRDIRGRTNDTSSLPTETDYNTFFQTSASRFPGFIAFGIRPAGSFTYKLSFTALDAASADAIVVKGAVGGFVLTIDKTDDQGKIDLAFVRNSFTGVMLSGGVGIKLEFKPLSKKFFKPGSGSVADCEIKSFLNLAPGDFRFARMSFFAQALPGISLTASPGVGVKTGATTTVVSITLPVRIPTAILETTVKSGDFLKPKVTTPDVDSVKGALEKWKKALKSGKAEDVPTIQLSVSLYRLSLCVAIVLFSPDETPIIRPDGKLLTIDKLIDKTQSATLLMRGAEFPINSAFVSEKAHQLLEVRLAVMRKLLEYQGGFMDIQGSTSPEWAAAQQKAAAGPDKARAEARDANLKLSKARAEAVRDAIFASVGRPGQGIIDLERDVKALGFGPDPYDPSRTPAAAQPGALSFTDPFTPNDLKTAAGQANAAQVAKEQANEYWKMRNVDIQMNGAFTVRLKSTATTEIK